MGMVHVPQNNDNSNKKDLITAHHDKYDNKEKVWNTVRISTCGRDMN